MPPLVMIESPYRSGDRNQNLRYLAWCEFHSATLGEVPVSSHGNCTAYWPETDEFRLKGFAWRQKMRGVCDLTVFYTDLGMTHGMLWAEQQDHQSGLKTIRRILPSDLKARFDDFAYPLGSMRRIAI
jgi:hypothetical protein